MKTKYPRTHHAPFSLGATSDDKVHRDLSFFEGREVIITQKMDGENLSAYRDGTHARSLDSRHHPSRDWCKEFWGQRQHLIPEDWRVCGENLYAQHAIRYDSLPSFFMAFSVWNEKNECLSWDETIMFLEDMGVMSVPVEYRGLWNEKMAEKLFHLVVKDGGEGIVIRAADSFHYDDFRCNVAKAVRANHVMEGDERWEVNWTANKMVGG